MITFNSRVLIKKNAALKGGTTNNLKKWQSSQVYGIIYSKLSSQDLYTPATFIGIYFCNSRIKQAAGLYIKDLEEIQEGDYAKYEKIEEEFNKEFFKTQDNFLLKFTTPYLKTYPDYNFKENKNGINGSQINTFNTYALQGSLNKAYNSEVTTSKIWNHINTTKWCQGCADYIKVCEDFIFYLPQAYANFFSYSTWDIEQWLRFLLGCNINFNYIFDGVQDFPKEFNSNIAETIQSQIYNSNTLQLTRKDKFLAIRVFSGTASWHNYLYYVLLRYIHDPRYCFIPALAMQIKDELGEEITNFQALLMAHLHKRYNDGRHGLITYGNIPNIFIEPKQILLNIAKGKMNGAFVYLSLGKENLNKCQDFIEKREFKQLFEYLKQNQ